MLKFILIFFLFFWLVFKLGGFFVRLFLGKVANEARQQQGGQYQYQQQQKQQPRDGNVNIDYVPKEKGKKNDKTNFKGGDYVDYEEV
ncbi:DUF4834 family protein [Reichenbachiella ulvae]|uniref:DUF4834 family protein n=1 Tax=Reichenbachiella ulvae TaxID=2980104 RepID=A0ABT3CX21_9BACT|nr:DUF4834 family protein [Reichenbachiella ulvae]MCV9388255.1 DUF4834 family protein [Reichenbachiella ulvae]